jgi:DNA-nicking Smr family endonuclease
MTKPPDSKSRPAERALSKDEAELWQQVTGDVSPLPESHDLVDHPESGPAAPSDKPLDTPSEENSDVPPPPPVAPPAPPPSRAEPALTHGHAPGLDRRTQINLRRVKARIDLHGMTQEQAHGALGDFLADSQAAGRRSVLVITGKGRGKDGGGTGILREAVPKWLNEGANRGMIRAFSHAQPKDGGEGALYVLLKRLK